MNISQFAVITLVMFCFSSFAEVSKSPAENLIEKIDSSARSLAISTEQYVEAAHNFERLIDNGMDVIPLHLTETFKEYDIYASVGAKVPAKLQKKMLNLINERKALFASKLGLDVNNLDRFVNFYSDERFRTLDSTAVATAATTTERIEVYCSGDECNADSPYSINMSLTIYTRASQAGIPQYREFRVDFKDANTSTQKKAEIWKYNNFTGAWMVRSAPCDACNVDY